MGGEEMEEGKQKKGVGLKVFGISLVILASLNMMLSWRGGFPMGAFHPVVLIAGISFFFLGILLSRR